MCVSARCLLRDIPGESRAPHRMPSIATQNVWVSALLFAKQRGKPAQSLAQRALGDIVPMGDIRREHASCSREKDGVGMLSLLHYIALLCNDHAMERTSRQFTISLPPDLAEQV